MFVWWDNDSNEEEKGNWDTKRLQKFKIWRGNERHFFQIEEIPQGHALE